MNDPVSRLATAEVMHADGQRVLLHTREDFHLWALPESGLEAGETPEQASIRETLGEMDYRIEVERCVGAYHNYQLQNIRDVNQGRMIGREPIECGSETLAVAWFTPYTFSLALRPMMAEMITAALHPSCDPGIKSVHGPIWQVWAIRILTPFRNLRNRLQRRR